VLDDKRNLTTESDIYAQRLAADGTTMWATGGLDVCTASKIQATPALAVDGYGGAVFAWQDFRAGMTFAEVYAQRVGHGGDLGSLASVPKSAGARMSLSAWPNPTRAASRIRVTGGEGTLAVCISDLGGRTVRTLLAASTGREKSEVAWNLRDEMNRRVPPGMYWIRARSQTGEGPAQATLIVLR
jgi:hypothetical protein